MPASPPCEIAEKIEKLRELPLRLLKERWAETYSTAPPAAARADYLIRGISYRLQEQVYGRLPLPVAKRLVRSDEPTTTERRKFMSSKLRSGSRLLREWQGTTHEVEVVEGGYVYDGATYRSLSEIARLITGTRWSGPLFFGLKRKTGSGAEIQPGPRFVVDLTTPPPVKRPAAAEASHAL